MAGNRGSLPLVALVDNVRSLWNVGSIFRTADACGVREIVLAGITGFPPRPEISKTALGAELCVPWRHVTDAHAELVALTEAGYVGVALESTPHAVPLEEMAWPDRVFLIVGHEVKGVSPRLLDACERHVSIPMRGTKESLNVAVAFGIAAYHVARCLAARQQTTLQEEAV